MFKYTCYLIAAILPQLITKLAFTKITSIMKITKRFAGEYIIEKDKLFFSASYQDVSRRWFVQPINNEVHDYLHCDTLRDCKDAVLYGFFEDEPLKK